MNLFFARTVSFFVLFTVFGCLPARAETALQEMRIEGDSIFVLRFLNYLRRLQAREVKYNLKAALSIGVPTEMQMQFYFKPQNTENFFLRRMRLGVSAGAGIHQSVGPFVEMQIPYLEWLSLHGGVLYSDLSPWVKNYIRTRVNHILSAEWHAQELDQDGTAAPKLDRKVLDFSMVSPKVGIGARLGQFSLDAGFIYYPIFKVLEKRTFPKFTDSYKEQVMRLTQHRLAGPVDEAVLDRYFDQTRKRLFDDPDGLPKTQKELAAILPCKNCGIYLSLGWVIPLKKKNKLAP